MKLIVFAVSMLTLSCSLRDGLPEGDAGGDAIPVPPDSASQDSEDVTKVVPPSPPGSVEECHACNGDWGMHSLSDAISGTESCDCRTDDAGKTCTDGSDCQGMCVASADNPEYDVVDIGPPARGFLVGRCSEFVVVFGCNALVDSGARDAGPISIVRRPPVLCVD
jgi:hypothetical protein